MGPKKKKKKKKKKKRPQYTIITTECVTASRAYSSEIWTTPSSSFAIQHEVLPFSPLWLHVRSAFPCAKISTFSISFFLSFLSFFFLGSPLWTATNRGLEACVRAHDAFWQDAMFWLPRYALPKVWFELRNGRGHPSCILRPLVPGKRRAQYYLDSSGIFTSDKRTRARGSGSQ